ncbi:conjugal transfer protein TraO [Muricauda sp. CAU 1633]|uniref:conjugal transfer protein TraO n=1 Tax=Allomuricauda sp. CAU 1633 TaxID=2816036 RepID=UPI001A904835|nr:conjugal transfer protein TraO [Muricauda sp. CAU 1633]MBO0321195.1 conjugal transfer protein TraO [Muricauda sp. CAU 1633]
MRKTYAFNLGLWALFLISIQQIHSQRSNFSVGVVPTYKTDGYGIQLNVNHYHSTTDYLQVSLVAAFSKEQPDSGVEFPYHDYLFNLGYFTTILTSPKRGFFIFFGGGPSVGYKYINNGETEFPFDAVTAESSFIYGGFASFEMDFFLSDAFSLFVPTSGFYHFNSDLNDTMLLLGVGIRYYLK